MCSYLFVINKNMSLKKSIEKTEQECHYSWQQGWLRTRSHQNWKYKAPKVIMKLIFLKKLNNLDFHNVFQIPLKIMYHKHCYQNSCWYICIVPCFKQKNSRYKKSRTFLYNPCQLSIDWKPFEKRKDHICCDIFFASKSKIPDNIQVK